MIGSGPLRDAVSPTSHASECVAVDEDARRADGAVLHAVRVRVGQRGGQLRAHAGEGGLGDRALAQHQRQRLAGDALEHERALGVRGESVDVVDLEQVRVVQAREVADLLDPLGEHLARRRAGG